MTRATIDAVREWLSEESRRVAFEPTAHRYTSEGRTVVSVTQVLRHFFPDTFRHVDPAVLERKRQIGEAVHQATHLWDRGQLDESTLAPEVRGYFEGWRRFLEEHRPVLLATELRLVHRLDGYAGTLDKLAWFPTAPAGPWPTLTLIDLKTGDPAAARTHLQTAGYEGLLRGALASPGLGARFAVKRLGVQLLPEGRARCTVYVNPRDFRRFATLRDALTVLREEDPDVSTAVA